MRVAIEAVFRSWNGDRAVAYRAVEGIPDDRGTGVTVQAMVFGNRGRRSGTSVRFTRDPETGENTLFRDVLLGAGAATHATESLDSLGDRLPDIAARPREHARVLEHHLADMYDIEFTVEEGRL